MNYLRFGVFSAADREVQRILLELLNQMDGFDQNVNVKVSPLLPHAPVCADGDPLALSLSFKSIQLPRAAVNIKQTFGLRAVFNADQTQRKFPECTRGLPS